jgi:hypothetical protein
MITIVVGLGFCYELYTANLVRSGADDGLYAVLNGCHGDCHG